MDKDLIKKKITAIDSAIEKLREERRNLKKSIGICPYQRKPQVIKTCPICFWTFKTSRSLQIKCGLCKNWPKGLISKELKDWPEWKRNLYNKREEALKSFNPIGWKKKQRNY